MCSKVLLTGGNGDLARFLQSAFSNERDVVSLSKNQLDVRSRTSLRKVFQKHHFDTVIHTAGTINPGHLTEIDPESWTKDLDVNIVGTFHLCQLALNANPKCRLILLSSTAAFNAYSDWTSYCISKYAQVNMAWALIEEGFDVVCLCPGAIDTKFRNTLNKPNPNLMTLAEASVPILEASLSSLIEPGVYAYRKNTPLTKMEKHKY